MAESSTSRTNPLIEGSKHYPYPSHVNAASFVSEKLFGRSNYKPWKERMMCLLESHDMLGFIDGTLMNPREISGSEAKSDVMDFEAMYREWKRSDSLVKGWIFGSLIDGVMGTVSGFQTANKVWDELKRVYAPPPPKLIEENDTIMDERMYVPLCKAIQTGNWAETHKFLEEHPDALTCKLNDSEERTLHIAVGNPANINILKNLLKRIHDPELLISMVDEDQENALHFAARLDNIEAAKMLVEKNPKLLFTVDEDNSLPIERAITNSHKKTFRYLFEACKSYITLCSKNDLQNPFEDEHGALLLHETIFSGVFDVAFELLQKDPKLATALVDDKSPLYWIAKKWDACRSAKPYNFYERFVYDHVPVENSLDKRHNKQDIETQDMPAENNNINSTSHIEDSENQETVMTNLGRTYNKNYINQVLKWINDKCLQVQHIKRLHDDKVEHITAIKILKFICREFIGKLKSDHHPHILYAFIVAVENNSPEVLRIISRVFPSSVWAQDDNDYTLSQLSIINRCEGAYNFLVHEVTQEKYLHYRRVEEFNGNNLLHLAGKLAPAHKLNMVTGAALQMQRELQWFKEVEKIMRPRDREHKNKENQTPFMLFRKEHEDLRGKGENWMKKTADAYTITAALIVTIVFAAAITVPGGNKEDTGKPTFETEPSFVIFAVADAISLFTSTTSLLLFLSILTARYAQEDFLYKLPKRLILGLVMLFMSVTTMMIAFSATLYIMFGQEKSWILIPIAALTCLPIASFVTLQLPLLYDLISSTYGRGIFYEGKKLSVKSSLPYKPKSSLLAN